MRCPSREIDGDQVVVRPEEERYPRTSAIAAAQGLNAAVAYDQVDAAPGTLVKTANRSRTKRSTSFAVGQSLYHQNKVSPDRRGVATPGKALQSRQA